MKLSVVTSNEDFITFLNTRATGMQILNRYRTLSDEKEFNKFSEDFNYVDTLLFLDFQDLSKEFKEFLNYLNNGKSYFLNTEEILLITFKDPTLSKTPNLEDNLLAIQAFLEKKNLNLRIVRLDDLKFQDIYKSLTSADSVRDNAPKKYIKYKVTHNNEGVTIAPKKADVHIVPDKLKGNGSVHKLEDLKNARMLEHTSVNVPNIVEPVRTEKDFKDYLSLTVTDTVVVFISGLRYSGKTTLALRCAKDLQEQNFTSAVLDLTGRDDLRLLNKEIKCDLDMIKGLSPESSIGSPVLGLKVFNKVYTPSFLTGLIKDVTNNRTVSFCEVDPEELSLIYNSFRGNKVVLLVVPNNLTMIRDSITLANTLDFPVVPVVNNSHMSKQEVHKEHLKDAIQNSKAIYSIDDLSDLTSNLLR